VRIGSTPTTQFGTVGIEYANGLQTAGKLDLVELWISARAGKTSNVYESIDPIRD